MPENYVQQIVELAHSASARYVEQPSAQDWLRLEDELGLTLPPDYKLLVSTLGSGRFGAGLYLRNPVAASEYIQLSDEQLRAYRDVISFLEERIGIEFYPAAQGLVSIGGIDRQELFLRPEPNAAVLSNLVWLDHDMEELRDLHMSVAQFIYALYTERIEEEWAPELRTAIWFNEQTPFFTP